MEAGPMNVPKPVKNGFFATSSKTWGRILKGTVGLILNNRTLTVWHVCITTVSLNSFFNKE